MLKASSWPIVYIGQSQKRVRDDASHDR